jgi:aminoglycoside 3-N-acetyltransferase
MSAVAAMLSRISRLVPEGEPRYRLKKYVNRARGRLTRAFFRYDAGALLEGLRSLGIAEGDTLLVHSAVKPFSGFSGTPLDVIETLLRAVGPSGTVLMMSMPFDGLMADYAATKPVFDVLKTPSRMGLLTEVFRRRKGVVRSIHPTHPVLAAGARAVELTASHERCSHPCGAGSPLEKFVAVDGKVLFLDVPFTTFTLIHHIEDLVSGGLPFPLYNDEPYRMSVITAERQSLTVDVYGFSEEARKHRNPARVKQTFVRKGLVRRVRVGNSSLMIIRAQDAVRLSRELAVERPLFTFEA